MFEQRQVWRLPVRASGLARNNRIYDHDAAGNVNAGIAIDLGSTNNIVTDAGTFSRLNVGPADLIDENANCDNNLWFGNKFNTRNQPCID